MLRKTDNYYSSEMEAFIDERIGNRKLSHTQIAKDFLEVFDVAYTVSAVAKKVERKRNDIPVPRRTGVGIKRMFFDIETSPCLGWFWRPGYGQNVFPHQIIEYAKVICISWKYAGEDKVHNLNWDSEQCDKEMLEAFSLELDKADEIIAHNGDRFDEKWLRTRFIYHRIPAMPKYKTLDTLKKARGGFNFPSNKLDEIGKYLGVGRKLTTEPKLWEAVWQHNDREALKRMVAYCDQDVLLLEDVFNVMNNYIQGNTNVTALTGDERWRCPECSSSNVVPIKRFATAMGTPQRWMECTPCSKKFKITNKSYMKYMEFKIGNK